MPMTYQKRGKIIAKQQQSEHDNVGQILSVMWWS